MPKKGKNKRRKTTPDEIAGHLRTEIKKGNPESEPEFFFHSFLTNLKLLT